MYLIEPSLTLAFVTFPNLTLNTKSKLALSTANTNDYKFRPHSLQQQG